MIRTLPSQVTILVHYRSPNSAISQYHIILRVVQLAATFLGECLVVGDFNTQAIDKSIRTYPNSDGFDKTSLLLQGKYYSTNLSHRPHISGWETGRQQYT